MEGFGFALGFGFARDFGCIFATYYPNKD